MIIPQARTSLYSSKCVGEAFCGRLEAMNFCWIENLKLACTDFATSSIKSFSSVYACVYLLTRFLACQLVSILELVDS